MSTMAIQESPRDKLFLILNYLYLTAAFLIVAYPVIYMLSASISNPQYVGSGEMWLWPKGITFEGYKRVFENTRIWNGYWNTIIYTVTGTAVSLAITLPAAYALSRRDFIGRSFLMGMFMVTMFFGGGLVPTYLLVKDMGMINTIWAIILPGAASIYNIIVTRTFFMSTIPENWRKLPRWTEHPIHGCSSPSSCRSQCRSSPSWRCFTASANGTATSPH